MPTEKKIARLVINQVDSEETLKAMEDAGLINDDELYLIKDNGEDELVLDTTLTVEGGIPDAKAVGDRMTSAEEKIDAVEDRVEPIETKLAGIANVGTITGVSANGTSVATSGVANIPAASTSEYGVTKLSSATNSTSTTLAATASAVKAAYDLASSKMDSDAVIAVAQGGTGQTSIVDTTYTTARYRASSLHSSETNPTNNGVICWTYE